MSLGYAGHARLEVEDDEIAIYSYTGENRNVRDEDASARSKARKGSLSSASPVSSSWRCMERSKDCLAAGRFWFL